MTTPLETARNNQHWLVAVGMLAALTHGLALLADYPPSPDAMEYKVLGVALSETGTLQLPTGEYAKRMPLYPAFLGAVHSWQAREVWESGVLILQSIMAFATTLFIAAIARVLADRRAGFVAGTIAALYAPFRMLQVSFLTETLFLFLLSAAVLLYVAVCLRNKSGIAQLVSAAGVSILLGLAVLTRANALVLLIPFAIDALLRQGSPKLRSGRALLIVFPAVLCIVPWALRNQERVGAFTLSTIGGLNFYLGHNAGYADHPDMANADYALFDRLRVEEGLSEIEADQRLYDDAWAFIRANPGQTVRNTLSKLVVWGRSTVAISSPTLLFLVLLVLFAGGWRRWRQKGLKPSQQSLYLIVLICTLPIAVYWASEFFQTSRPWTSPLYVVPAGLLAMLFMRTQPRARALFIGFFLSQLAVAVVFIPLARLRWTVDGLLIVAIGVGVSRLCQWLCPTASLVFSHPGETVADAAPSSQAGQEEGTSLEAERPEGERTDGR